jgi:hypothetical protein
MPGSLGNVSLIGGGRLDAAIRREALDHRRGVALRGHARAVVDIAHFHEHPAEHQRAHDLDAQAVARAQILERRQRVGVVGARQLEARAVDAAHLQQRTSGHEALGHAAALERAGKCVGADGHRRGAGERDDQGEHSTLGHTATVQTS